MRGFFHSPAPRQSCGILQLEAGICPNMNDSGQIFGQIARLASGLFPCSARSGLGLNGHPPTWTPPRHWLWVPGSKAHTFGGGLAVGSTVQRRLCPQPTAGNITPTTKYGLRRLAFRAGALSLAPGLPCIAGARATPSPGGKGAFSAGQSGSPRRWRGCDLPFYGPPRRPRARQIPPPPPFIPRVHPLTPAVIRPTDTQPRQSRRRGVFPRKPSWPMGGWLLPRFPGPQPAVRCSRMAVGVGLSDRRPDHYWWPFGHAHKAPAQFISAEEFALCCGRGPVLCPHLFAPKPLDRRPCCRCSSRRPPSACFFFPHRPPSAPPAGMPTL